MAIVHELNAVLEKHHSIPCLRRWIGLATTYMPCWALQSAFSLLALGGIPYRPAELL